NRIYATVFDPSWVRENLPDAEQRRQRTAFRRGVFRTGAISSVVGAAMLFMAFRATNEAKRATQHEQKARYLLNVADLGLADRALHEMSVERVLRLEEAHTAEAKTEFEWGYLWNQCHQEIAV